MERDIKIGLALSGGGARGVAHLGVLQALEDNGIEASVFSGASAGAIASCMYAAGKSPKEILALVKKASLFKLITMTMPYSGLTKLSYLRSVLEEQIAEDDFSVLKKEIHIAISNLNTGDLEIKNSGPLFDVIVASSSIPLVFQPVEIEGQTYVDGGLLDNMPVEPLIGKADIILGVNVMPHLNVEKKAIKSMFGIAQRCFDLSILANTRPSISKCDLLIEPADVQAYSIFQLGRYQELFDIGYKAMEAQIPQLQQLIKQKKELISTPKA